MSSSEEALFNETVRANVIRMQHEVNILRDLANLPPTSFPSFNEHNERRGTNPNAVQGFEIFYHAFERLYSQHRRNQEIARINSFSAEIAPLLTRNNLTRDQRGSVLYLLSGNNVYYSIEYDAERDRIIASAFPFENKTNIISLTDFQAFIDSTLPRVRSIYQTAASEIQAVTNHINNPEVRRSFSEKRIRAVPITENNDFFNTRLFRIDRINNQFIANLSYSYEQRGFLINGNFYGNSERIKDIILNIEDHIDIRSNEERMVGQAIRDINRIAEDPAFKMFLEGRGYFLSLNPREDSLHIFFDFLPKAGGSRIGSFAINKYTGDTSIKDFEEIHISSIRTLNMFNPTDQDQKKKLDSPAAITIDRSRFHNFLIAGNHEKNSDTVMVASLDRSTQTLNIISLPRDIFFRGRRLNTYYRIFGPQRLREIVESITGLHISRYFIIDMYAFVDVVNILGGIEITLEQDLVDPTYRVRNNGVWSTLYYRRGTHHLNGIETLRVARARNFMPAFSRDDRQQKILIALLNRISELSITDFDRIFNIIRTVITYLDTDISIPESLGLLNDLRNIREFNRIILSTDNVLVQTYTNLMYLGMDEDEVSDDFDKGAWILMPINNDWDSIPYFLQNVIQGNSNKNEILD